jgi:1-deoxy-D-xylulose-5-phosphate synthase
MNEIMAADPKAVACTVAMPGGTGMDKVMARFPDRSFDTGICESHALDMMAGMAKTGLRPYLAVYSTFLQRAFDQAFQEVSLQGLGVRLCLDRAGLVGGDGAVHHGFCDISILRVLPSAIILGAMDEPSLKAGLEFMRTQDTSLTAIRYPRDNASGRFASECPPFELGKARALIEHANPDVAVMAFGVMAISSATAIDLLGPEHRVSLYDARFAKPVDRELIRSLLTAGVPIVTVEDHGPHGGFGAAVVEAACEMGLDGSRITRLAMPDSWIYQNSRNEQLAEAGLDPASIARAIREVVDAREPNRPEVVVRTTGAPAPTRG